MIAAIIFMVSVVAFAQFGLYYWRATISRIAAQAISERIRVVAGIRAYYAVVEKLGSIVPAMAKWADAEMATCSRYVAVLMDQHLERNMACAAQVRGI